MKDKNLPNDYNSLSLEELTTEANKMIEELENQKDLGNSLDKYQDLIKLNNIIEKKFHKPKFNEIMLNPEYKEYINLLLEKAMIKKYNVDDFDIDTDSYEEVKSVLQEITDTEISG